MAEYMANATGDEEDKRLMDSMDKMLSTGEPVPLAQDTNTEAVLLHIKNTGVRLDGFTEGHVLAMCDRGLCVRREHGASESFLSCVWHPAKKFFWVAAAMDHFKSFGYHRNEEKAETLEDCKNRMEEEQQTTAEGSPNLHRLPLQKGMGLARKMAWNPYPSPGFDASVCFQAGV